MSKKINLGISGIHCISCKHLIETEVGGLKGVKSIEVDYQSGEACLEFENDALNEKEIRETIEKLGYGVLEKNEQKKEDGKKDDANKNKLLFYFFLLALFLAAYFLIGYFGGFEVLSRLNEKNISYGLVVLIGFLASFHCIGMCGGLVVTYSINRKQKAESRKQKIENRKQETESSEQETESSEQETESSEQETVNSEQEAVNSEQETENSEQETENRKQVNLNSHFQYNLGRLISYTIIGGILGGFGSFFGINPSFSGFVILLAGVFMMLMGLSIFTNFKWLEAVKLKTPASIAKFLYKNKKSEKPKGPLVIGLLTGFMPCGPLQAMQLFALTTGSIFEGAMAMFLYALGTIPLMFGFGSVVSAISNVKLKQIVKFSGAVVVVLGLFMINRGLVNFGLGFRSLIPEGLKSKTEFLAPDSAKEFQVVEMDVTNSGYKPNIMYLKKDIPVRWIIRDKGITGCTDEIFLYHEIGTIKKKLNQEETVIEFTPTKIGELKFSCWMKMVWGKFIVTDDGAGS